MKRVVLAIGAMTGIVLLPPRSGAAEPELILDARLPYQARRLDPVDYRADFSVTVTAPHGTRLLKVWLPLPQSDAGQHLIESQLETFPVEIEPRVGREPVFGNQFAYFEFADPQGAQIIRHRFQVRVWELRWDIDPSRIATIDQWPDQFDPYLKGDRAIVVDDHLQGLLDQVLANRADELHPLAAVMLWTNDYMTYDHKHASLSASSQQALLRRRGHCSDYHGLCAAMGRALGFPTRVTYGINLFPKSSPSHCKLEAFVPPYGWASFDLSETQRLIAKIRKSTDIAADPKPGGHEPDVQQFKSRLIRAAQQRLLSGFRDNTWLMLTQGTDYQLEPPASRSVNVVRTIYAEADGEPLPEPDPANPSQREFAWMTAHRFTPDRPVAYPFGDWRPLVEEAKAQPASAEVSD